MPDKLLCLDCRLLLKCVSEGAEMIEYDASGSKTHVTDVYECEKCHAGVVTFRPENTKPEKAVQDV